MDATSATNSRMLRARRSVISRQTAASSGSAGGGSSEYLEQRRKAGLDRPHGPSVDLQLAPGVSFGVDSRDVVPLLELDRLVGARDDHLDELAEQGGLGTHGGIDGVRCYTCRGGDIGHGGGSIAALREELERGVEDSSPCPPRRGPSAVRVVSPGRALDGRLHGVYSTRDSSEIYSDE